MKNEQRIPLASIEEFNNDNLQPEQSTHLLSDYSTPKYVCDDSDLAEQSFIENASQKFPIFASRSPKSKKPVKDRCNLVFFILILHGIGILMPWNMFTTAKVYFTDYKLFSNNTNDTAVGSYAHHFLSYLGIATHIPNVACNALNVFVQCGDGRLTFRIITSILIEICIFIVTIILAMLDSSTWPGEFFYVTMASVVIINMANGVYQNCVYGVAARLPMKYSMAVVFGSNISGVFTALISILSLAVSPNVRTAAIYYFMTALFVLLVCIDTYFALPLSHFYQFHNKAVKRSKANLPRTSQPPFLKIFKKVWLQCFNVFFVFFVTLTIYPAIHAQIDPVDPNFVIPKTFFTPVTCFLCFNFFAMVGSLLPNWLTFPGPRFLWIPIVLRAFMIPYFMLCNYNPNTRRMPVLINNDWAYFGMAMLHGFSSGYLSSLAMMYAPRCVKAEHASTAAMLAALFLVLGVVFGVHFTLFCSWIVETRLIWS